MGKIKFKLRDADCCDYLLGFVKANPLPSHGFIFIADLYGQTEPWELFKDSQVKDGGCRYFFTKLKKVNGKKGRSYQCYSRNVGADGNWSNKGSPYDQPQSWLQINSMDEMPEGKVITYARRQGEEK